MTLTKEAHKMDNDHIPPMKDNQNFSDSQDPGNYDEQLPPELALQQTIETLSPELSSSAKITIYRIPDLSNLRILEYIIEMSPQEFMTDFNRLEGLRTMYGGGNYMVHIQDSKGKLIKGGRRQIRIASPTKKSRAFSEPEESHGGYGGFAEAIREIARSQMEGFRIIAEKLAAPVVSPVDPIAMITQLHNLRKDLLPDQKSGGEIEQFTKFLALMNEMQKQANKGGGNHGGRTVYDLVETYLPKFFEMVPKFQRLPNPAVAGKSTVNDSANITQKNATAAGPEAAAEIAKRQQEEWDVFKKMLEPMLKELCTAAAANMDVNDVAAQIAPQLPENIWQLLEQANWIDVLADIYPPCNNVRPWLIKLHGVMLTPIGEPDKNGDKVNITPPPDGHKATPPNAASKP
jgi:hypothetical protein